MKQAQNNTPKRKEIVDIGKIAFIGELLQKTGSVISNTLQFGQLDNKCMWTSSHRLFLEGIDFDLTYTPLKYLGYKCVVLAAGPIYAKNYIPHAISINLGISGRFSANDIEDLWSGITSAIEEYKISAVNLDLNSSLTGLAISVSVQGKQTNEAIVQKREASSGDLICITGSLGAAYMGLQILEREKTLFSSTSSQPKLDDYKFILKAYLNPQLNTSIIEEMNNNEIFATHGEFISSGLSDAVKRCCLATGYGAKIFLSKIPIATQTFNAAEEINIDATTAALNGGEDVQFIFTIPLAEHEKIQKELPQLDIIGHLCSPEKGTLLVTPDGLELELKAQGWSK